MGLWRDILRALGLTNDARVQISAPGIDVVITGDPEQVRQLLGVVKHELERVASRRVGEGRWKDVPDSQVVRPTELDEMDSPYALPEAMVMPVREEDSTADEARKERSIEEDTLDQPHAEEAGAAPAGADDLPTAEIRAFREQHSDVAATVLPEDARLDHEPKLLGAEDHANPGDGTKHDTADLERTESAPDDELTRITDSPSGGVPVPTAQQREELVTDGGPTLLPNETDLQGTDPEVPEVSDSDRGA